MLLLNLALIVHGQDSWNTGPKQIPKPAATPKVQKKAPVESNWLLPRVTDRPANTKGKVFVVMYHHIREGTNPMFRSASAFRRDLERLYKLGFRPVTVTEFVNNKMILPPGASPVVMTFDDSHPNQFQLRKDGSIDPKTAVGIWADFAKSHPDFPVKGTWYVLPVLWGQKSLQQQKIKMLQEMGSEVGNHTYHHKFLGRLNDEQVKNEIGKMHDLLVKMGVPEDMPFCPPYGEYPKNKQLVRSFKWSGKVINHSSACMAWDSPAVSPEDPKFDRYKFERLHGNGRAMGIDYWLDRVQSGKLKPYVAP